MDFLITTYECKVDAKGRLPLPAGFKKQIQKAGDEGFILKRSVFQPCIELHLMENWKEVMVKINKLNRFVAKNNDFIRKFTAGVKHVEMDSNGRVQISKDLINFASIDKEIVISALGGGVFEIWNKDKYEAVVNYDNDDFAQLAEEVMGNLDSDELS